MKNDLMTVRAFASEVGLSTVRLYTLWKQGRGPERVVLRDDNAATGRVFVSREAGLLWAAEREATIHPSMKLVRQAEQGRAENARRIRNEAVRASARVLEAL